jgi:hypothetical protein
MKAERDWNKNMLKAPRPRWRDIMDGPSSPVDLRELAGLKFSLKEVQVAVGRGDAKAREDLVVPAARPSLRSIGRVASVEPGDART